MAYTTANVSNANVTVTHVYDSIIKDRLVSFNNSSISYNSNGYPTYYNNKNYIWTKDRLTRIFRGNGSQYGSLYEYCNFSYDGYGRRKTKSYSYDPNPGTTNDYSYMYTTTYDYDASGRLIHEYCIERYTYTGGGSHTRDITYLYDESGIVGAIQKYDSTEETYYFDRNIKGDVIGIIDENGTVIVKYGYDSWGNCSVLSNTNSTISGANSIRYRGYYLDSETGFYCLSARFYNPKWRRFISPDSTEYLDPETQNGSNLYAYCINNPVMYIDPSGNLVIEWIMLYLYVLMAAAAALLVAGVVITIKALCDWIKSMIDEAGKEADEFVDYVANNLTSEDVADIGGQVIDASFNSSNVKRAYELHGAGGDVKYALFEEYEVKFDWDD